MRARAFIALLTVLVLGGAWQAAASPSPIDLGTALDRPEDNPRVALMSEVLRFTRLLEELPVAIPYVWRRAGLDPIDYHLYTLMADESWDQWKVFQRTPGMSVPLGSIKNVLIMVRAGYMAKRPLAARTAVREGPPGAVMYTPRPGGDEGSFRLLRFLYYSPPPRQLGLLNLEVADKARGFSLAGLLTEEQGIFSARPWSWENFLPRLFTVAGIMAAGLVTVELLHFIISGLTRIRGRSRSQEADEEELYI